MTIPPGRAAGHRGYPVVRLIAAFTLMTVGLSAMYATIVLKPVAMDSNPGAARPAVHAVRAGLRARRRDDGPDRRPHRDPGAAPHRRGGAARLFFAAAQAQTLWQFCLAQSVAAGSGRVIDVLALVSDISHWFTKRRGLALAIVISGSYMAGTIWPPVLRR